MPQFNKQATIKACYVKMAMPKLMITIKKSSQFNIKYSKVKNN